MSDAISASELSDMQATAARFLPDCGTILRPTAGTADGAGGYIGGTINVAGTVPCRIRPAFAGAGNRESETANQMQSISLWIISTPAGTDIQGTDQFASGGITYEVVGTAEASSWEIDRRFYARVVK